MTGSLVRRATCWCAILLGFGAGQGSPAQAQSTGQLDIADIRVGFAGQYKVGYWTPVVVDVSGPPGTVRFQCEVIAADSDGVPVSYVGPPRAVELVAGGRATFIEYVKIGRPRSPITVRLVNDGKLLGEMRLEASDITTGLGAHQPLLVTLRESVELEQAARQVFSPNEPPVSVVVTDAAALPDQWYGYESVHTVVLTTSDFAWLDQLTPSQISALDEWVRQGGRLVISAGSGAATMVQKGAPWSTWLPGKLDEVAPLRRSSAIETYAVAEQRLGVAGREFRIDMALLSDVRGRIDAADTLPTKGERPLVVRYPIGFGQAVFVAIDFDRPPVSQWMGRTRFLAKVLQNERSGQVEQTGRESQGQVAHLGFDDLVGQLRSALDQFPGVTAVAFGWIVTLIVVYVLVLGPAEYFLHRKLGRAELTWITFPMVALSLACLAFWMHGRLKDSRLRVNQVDVVDVELSTGLMRGTTWVNVYSPDSIRSDWSLSPPVWARHEPPAGSSPPAGQWLLSWQGVPGRGVGGLGSAATTLLASDSYSTRRPVFLPRWDDATPALATDSGDSGTIEALPIAVASTRIFSGRFVGTAQLLNDTHLRSESLDGQLKGSLTNPWPFVLKDWALLRGNWMYRGDHELEPGVEVSLNEYGAVRYLDWHLTRRRVSSDNKDISTPWDERSLDVPRIVEMMLFHRSAGGSGYTRIGSRYQQYLDLTEQLRLGRAVLVGRGPLVCGPLRDGQAIEHGHDQQVAFYRVVIPVQVDSARAKP